MLSIQCVTTPVDTTYSEVKDRTVNPRTGRKSGKGGLMSHIRFGNIRSKERSTCLNADTSWTRSTSTADGIP